MWIYFCRWRIEVRRSTQGREMEEIFGSQSCLLSVLRKFNSSSSCYWTETVYRQMFGFERNCMEEEHIIRNFRERALKLHICENLFYHRLEGAEILSQSKFMCLLEKIIICLKFLHSHIFFILLIFVLQILIRGGCVEFKAQMYQGPPPLPRFRFAIISL